MSERNEGMWTWRWALEQGRHSGHVALDVARSFSAPRRRRMAYIGWPGHGNLGDEAIFEAIREQFPSVHLRHFSGVRKESLLMRLFGARRLYQQAILGGGTLILGGYAGQLEKLLDAGIKCHTFGTGVEDPDFWEKLGRPLERERWKAVLKRMGPLHVRGPRSKAILERLGIENVSVVGDPTLLFALDRTPDPPPKKTLGVSLYIPKLALGDTSKLFENFVEVCRLAKADGWDLRIYSVAREDVDVNLQLARDVGVSPNSVDVECANGRAFVKSVSKCSVFLGVRLHSVILSHCACVPAISMAYQPKCWDYMESVAETEWAFACNSMAESIFSCIRRMHLSHRDSRPSLFARGRDLKRRLSDLVQHITVESISIGSMEPQRSLRR